MAIGSGVTLLGFPQDQWHFTFNLASGITSADEGKPVAIDTGAANKVKLCADNDPILGILVKVENRVQEGILVGTVALKGTFQVATSGSPTVGSQVQGNGSGGVKALAVTADANTTNPIAATSHQYRNFIAEIPTAGQAVIVLL